MGFTSDFSFASFRDDYSIKNNFNHSIRIDLPKLLKDVTLMLEDNVVNDNFINYYKELFCNKEFDFTNLDGNIPNLCSLFASVYFPDLSSKKHKRAIDFLSYELSECDMFIMMIYISTRLH